jgi:hypothetical protein
MNTILQSRSAFFAVGILVGIFGLWGALSIGDGPQIGVYARTLPSAVLPAETATTTSGSSYSSAAILVRDDRTDSSLSNYQLERDACCLGEGAK